MTPALLRGATYCPAAPMVYLVGSNGRLANGTFVFDLGAARWNALREDVFVDRRRRDGAAGVGRCGATALNSSSRRASCRAAASTPTLTCSTTSTRRATSPSPAFRRGAARGGRDAVPLCAAAPRSPAPTSRTIRRARHHARRVFEEHRPARPGDVWPRDGAARRLRRPRVRRLLPGRHVVPRRHGLPQGGRQALAAPLPYEGGRARPRRLPVGADADPQAAALPGAQLGAHPGARPLASMYVGAFGKRIEDEFDTQLARARLHRHRGRRPAPTSRRRSPDVRSACVPACRTRRRSIAPTATRWDARRRSFRRRVEGGTQGAIEPLAPAGHGAADQGGRPLIFAVKAVLSTRDVSAMPPPPAAPRGVDVRPCAPSLQARRPPGLAAAEARA